MTGTWGASDPSTRRLRIAAFFVLAALTSYAVVDNRDITVIGSLLGAFLIDLGFEAGLRLPAVRTPSVPTEPPPTEGGG